MNTLRLLCLAFALFLGFSTPVPASAQASDVQLLEETLPIEVKILYYKLLGEIPDFAEIVNSNPALQKRKAEFGYEAILLEQKKMLETMYEDAGLHTMVHAKRRMIINEMKPNVRAIKLEPLRADQPFLFEVGPGDTYGVFVRNTAELHDLKEPFVSDNIISLYANFIGNLRNLNVEFILKPLAADSHGFTMPDGSNVKVILADVVEMRILDPNGSEALLQKRFGGWTPNGGTSLLKDSISTLPTAETLTPKPMSDIPAPPPPAPRKGTGLN